MYKAFRWHKPLHAYLESLYSLKVSHGGVSCVFLVFGVFAPIFWETNVDMEGTRGPSRTDCAHALVDSCLAAIATLAWEVFTVVRYRCVGRLEMWSRKRWRQQCCQLGLQNGFQILSQQFDKEKLLKILLVTDILCWI